MIGQTQISGGQRTLHHREDGQITITSREDGLYWECRSVSCYGIGHTKDAAIESYLTSCRKTAIRVEETGKRWSSQFFEH